MDWTLVGNILATLPLVAIAAVVGRVAFTELTVDNEPGTGY